ncbi:hypothetical protein DIPPA_03278 [Diplonema papillatum]|nr:hypothetical protein DIPPA_03278 [Diplonema papillatum]
MAAVTSPLSDGDKQPEAQFLSPGAWDASERRLRRMSVHEGRDAGDGRPKGRDDASDDSSRKAHEQEEAGGLRSLVQRMVQETRQRRGSSMSQGEESSTSRIHMPQFMHNLMHSRYPGSDDDPNASDEHSKLKALREWQTREELFRAKVRAKQVMLDSQAAGDEISVLAILQYLVKEVKKHRMYKLLPFYLLFFIFLVSAAAITQFEGTESATYYMNIGVKDLFSANYEDETGMNDGFFNIVDEPSFYDWFELAATRVWQSGAGLTQANQVPLGFMVLRQWRVDPQDCQGAPGARALSPDTRQSLKECYPTYNSGDLSCASYGPALRWKCNANIPNPVASVSLEGALEDYDNPDYAFSTLFPYTWTQAQVMQEIAVLRTSGWIDQQTRLISVGYVMYDKLTDAFVHLELVLEVTAEAVWRPNVQCLAFRLYSLSEAADYSVLVLDSLVLLWVAYDLSRLIYTIKQDQELALVGYFAIGNWNTYCVLLQVAFGYFFYQRIRLWKQGLEVTDTFYEDRADEYGGDADKVMYQFLVEYASMYTKCTNVLAVILLMCALRLFSFFQYNQRLSVVTDTVRIALSNLVSLIAIYFIVLFGFAMGGHVLYGYDLEYFRTMWKAAGFLTRSLVSGRIDGYSDMERLHWFWTGVYWGTFFTLGWLLLLNLCSAVLTGVFMVVQEQSGDAMKWDLAVLLREIRTWWRKLRNQHLHHELAPEHEDFDRDENYIQSRLRSVGILKEWFFSDASIPEYITKQKLRDSLGGEDGVLCDASIDQIFRKSSRKVTAGTHAIRLGERWASQMQARTRAIEAAVARIQSYPLDKLGTLASAVEKIEATLDRTARSVHDVSSKTASLTKDVRLISTATHSTQAMEAQMMRDMMAVKGSVTDIGKKARRREKAQSATYPYAGDYYEPQYASPGAGYEYYNPSAYDYAQALQGDDASGVKHAEKAANRKQKRSRSAEAKKLAAQRQQQRQVQRQPPEEAGVEDEKGGAGNPLSSGFTFIDPGQGWDLDDPVRPAPRPGVAVPDDLEWSQDTGNRKHNKKSHGSRKRYLPDGKLDV